MDFAAVQISNQMTQVLCNLCGKEKGIDKFDRLSGGKTRKQCRKCCRERFETKLAIDSSRLRERNLKAARKAREWRENKSNRAAVVLTDIRKSDKKYGRQNDLTKEIVEDILKRGCGYCGDTLGQIGLDRIENSLGHLKSNVVPACTRCNLMRRDMPYAAWIRLVPVIRTLHQEGVFGTWLTKPFRKGRCVLVGRRGIEPR